MRTAELVAEVTCSADTRLFGEWEDVPDELKVELETNGGVPCEGTGYMNTYCGMCRFGTFEVEYVENK